LNYSQDANKIIKEAERVARDLGTSLDTEHVLEGIMSVPGSVAFDVLYKLGFKKDIIYKFPPKNPSRNLNLPTIDYEKVQKYAAFLANQEGVTEIDSYHLLVGLLSDPTFNSARILLSASITLDKVLKQLYSNTEKNQGQLPENNNLTSKKEKDEYLSQFGIDLISRAKEGKIDPVVGRTSEINRIIQILSRRTKNNPVIIGEPGVGKTAIVEGLALAIAEGNVPDILRGKRIFSLDVGSIVAGTKYRGDFEERFKKALSLLKDENTILFIDEIHMILKAGDSEGGMSIANLIKPILARGEIPTIGATTLDEYRKYVEKDAALERRFMPIIADPPSIEDTIKIIKGIKIKYENHHKVRISD
jgi:ATP-dependent Clp protease ATP-binding subunit ClpA